jgi:hypothetical protein
MKSLLCVGVYVYVCWCWGGVGFVGRFVHSSCESEVSVTRHSKINDYIILHFRSLSLICSDFILFKARMRFRQFSNSTKNWGPRYALKRFVRKLPVR